MELDQERLDQWSEQAARLHEDDGRRCTGCRHLRDAKGPHYSCAMLAILIDWADHRGCDGWQQRNVR